MPLDLWLVERLFVDYANTYLGADLVWPEWRMARLVRQVHNTPILRGNSGSLSHSNCTGSPEFQSSATNRWTLAHSPHSATRMIAMRHSETGHCFYVCPACHAIKCAV